MSGHAVKLLKNLSRERATIYHTPLTNMATMAPPPPPLVQNHAKT